LCDFSIFDFAARAANAAGLAKTFSAEEVARCRHGAANISSV
jgi:hypothetical protein